MFSQVYSNIIINLILLILIMLIGGILPLIERKYLSLIKRRVGPKYVGYKGRLQFIADALKVFLKGCFVPRESNKFFFFFWPSLLFSICLVFWINIYWGNNLIYFDIEYNVVFFTLLSIFIHIIVTLVGYFSKNKYAWLGSIRALFVFFCFELLIGVFFLIIFFYTKSFNIFILDIICREWCVFFSVNGMVNIICIIILIEVNKSPFDLTEAESELVTGYHLEYGGFYFGLFYLGEYFHLFYTSCFFSYILFGFN